LAFALIGGYLVIRSFAAGPLVASLEAEQMALSAGGSVVADSAASAGKAVLLSSNGTATGIVNFPSSVTSVTINARGVQCNGSPTMNVSIDGASLLIGTAVSSTAWNSYSATPVTAIAAGSHSLAISFTNDNTYSKRHHHTTTICSRDLYLDVTNFYGNVTPPPPAPTISLSASPTSLSAGQASTLTWNSTNASSCTASGAWSGSQPTTGSTSTGALNQSSSYTLSCTGSGGSTSATTTVAVSSSQVSPAPPIPPSSYTIPGGATTVTTASALSTALSSSATDIVVANGTYGGTSYSIGSKHLWAQNLGGAIFTAPITVGSGSIEGIKVDVASGTAISAGANSIIRDTWLEGHKTATYGILSGNPTGEIFERDVINGFTNGGIRSYDNIQIGYAQANSTPHFNHLSDLTVSEIGEDLQGTNPSNCGSSNGTEEAALFLGNPIDNGIQRLHLYNNCFLGINFVRNSFNINVSDVNIDGKVGGSKIGTIGIYFEHYSRNIHVTNFYIGPNVERCMTSEWDYGTGDRPATDIYISNGTCNANLQSGAGSAGRSGITIDAGSCRHQVTNVIFQNVNNEDIFVWRPAGNGTWASPVSNWTSGNTYNSTARNSVLVEESVATPCPSSY
jgi:hypothetical protein